MPQPQPSQLAWVKAPSVGAVGVAIDLRAALPSGSSPDAEGKVRPQREYTTYDVQGNRVHHSFRPFTGAPPGRSAAVMRAV